ncbi:component of SufBCD complex [Histidinibacterium aquaticum]|uniref:Component of SufBCD complex n=1 Tax=Histidinibacterium aquaticum TaxID=2613962 RepID=A0A5J5GNB7_9RHOB|nr:component of SufBCD complex [Histidinibacterium aquaticum]KAA9009223.1 component of SufBCD complex [Histidinibacterium aquaticum]
MDWTQTIFEVIDMRSFSNLWFWIALAVVWSSASHWVLGVPFDMITRARRHGGQAQEDLETLVSINVRRLLFIGRVSGLVLIGFLCFLLTALAILGFVYDVEFAQALFLIGLPLSGVLALSLATARRLERDEPQGEELYRRLLRHRQIVQVIGMVSIFVTAFWGMAQNLSHNWINGF